MTTFILRLISCRIFSFKVLDIVLFSVCIDRKVASTHSDPYISIL